MQLPIGGLLIRASRIKQLWQKFVADFHNQKELRSSASPPSNIFRNRELEVLRIRRRLW
jgi:hypothetical protein